MLSRTALQLPARSMAVVEVWCTPGSYSWLICWCHHGCFRPAAGSEAVSGSEEEEEASEEEASDYVPSD